MIYEQFLFQSSFTNKRPNSFLYPGAFARLFTKQTINHLNAMATLYISGQDPYERP